MLMREISTLLGENVSMLRRKAGLTQEDLATGTKLSVISIVRIENGQTYPRASTIEAIANFFKIDPSELTKDHSTPENTPLAAPNYYEAVKRIGALEAQLEKVFSKEHYITGEQILNKLSESPEVKRLFLLALLYENPNIAPESDIKSDEMLALISKHIK